MKAYLLIVIDQLRYEEQQFFPRLNTSLGEPQRYRTAVFPTLTESVHASIATGSLPNVHGVVGDGWLGEDGRYMPIPKSPFLDASAGERLVCRALRDRGVDCFIVAGKSKVADIMAPQHPPFLPRGAIVASYRHELDGHYHLHIDDCRQDMELVLDLPDETTAPSRFLRLEDPEIDRALIGVADHLLENHRTSEETPLFVFVGLHRLDLMGHRQPREALGPVFSSIDASVELLVELFRERFVNPRIIVTADHGVRPVDRCIAYCKEVSSFIQICGSSVLDFRSRVRPEGDGYLMDGGTMRAWNPSERLSEVERAVTAFDGICSSFRPMRHHHAHWGDRSAEAVRDVALAKTKWLGVIDLKTKSVERPIVAEHGTSSPEDTDVPWWGTDVISHEGLRDDIVAFFTKPGDEP